MKIQSRLFALAIAAVLWCEAAAPLGAQLAAAPPKGLQIMILDGEGALNNIHDRTAREPVIQVQDENHRPVAGALILFTIHGGSSGAGATFANGLTTLSVTTDAEGKAAAHGIQLNENSGSWQISVNATLGNLTAGAVINENSVAPLAQASQASQASHAGNIASSLSHVSFFASKPVMLIAGAVVATTVATVVATKIVNNGTTINLGATTVGAPTPSVAVQVRFGKH